MQTLHYSTTINATPEKVWEVMLTDKTYREWTEVIHHGSFFEGSWEAGSDIRFVSIEADGKPYGLVAKIIESLKPESVVIQYIAELKAGEIVQDEAHAAEWAQTQERYTFLPVDEGTQLNIELTIFDDFVEPMQDAWPAGLAKLKQVVEAIPE